ncbi:unnamed protein product [Aureobasidium pullulans]|nr:unnamed protein product [Aureobasidium pullulans]
MSTMTTVANNYRGHEDAITNARARRSYVEASTPSDFQRSASYTFLGNAATKNPAYNAPSPLAITDRGSFCEQDLIAGLDESTDTSPPESSGWSTPADDQVMPQGLPQDLVAELHKSPKITVTADSEHTPSPPVSLKDGTSSIDSAKVLPAPVNHERSRSTSKSRSLAKRLSRRLSSAPPSRSPSPSNRTSEQKSDAPVQDVVVESPPVVSRPVATQRWLSGKEGHCFEETIAQASRSNSESLHGRAQINSPDASTTEVIFDRPTTDHLTFAPKPREPYASIGIN